MIINSLSKHCIWNLLYVYTNKVWLQSVRLVPALTFDKNRPSNTNNLESQKANLEFHRHISILQLVVNAIFIYANFSIPWLSGKNMGLFSQVDIFPLLTFLRVISYKPTTFTTTRSHFEELFEFGWPSWLLLLLT